jgi:transcriptional regulator with XRE-family HTH domain
MDHNALVARIEQRMKELGLNAKSLARAAGLAETYVRDLREGRSTNPRVSHLLQLATALGLTLGELVGEEPRGFRESVNTAGFASATDNPDDDDRYGQVATAVEAMLQEEQAPHDAGTVGRMTRLVWRAIVALPARMPFEDRLNFTLSERRSIVKRARTAMFHETSD